MNFDDFLKNSFEKEPFEFNEEYWIQVQALLDKEKRKRRIRRAALWGSLLLFLLTLLGLFLRNKGVARQENNTSLQSVEVVMAKEVLPALEPLQSAEVAEQGKLATAEGPDGAAGSMESSNKEAVKIETERILAQSAEVAEQGKLATAEGPDGAAGSMESSNKEAVKIETERILTQSAEVAEQGKLAAAEGSDGEAGSMESSNKEAVKIETERILTQSAEEVPLALEPLRIVNTEYFLLPVLDREGVLSLHYEEQTYPIGSIGRIPTRSGRWYMGLEFMNLPSLGQGEGTFNELGFSVLRWIPLSGNLFLETGLGLRGRTGDFNPSVTTLQTSFDFGYIEDRYTLRPQVFYTANLPLVFGYAKDKFQFTAGILCSGLLGAWGVNELQIYNAQEQGVVPSSEVLQQGWLETKGFSTFNISYLLGYKVHVLPSVQFGLFAEFRNRDWITQGYGRKLSPQDLEGLVPDPTALPSYRNISLGASLRYSFTSKPRI
jgi:hypothetical protein